LKGVLLVKLPSSSRMLKMRFAMVISSYYNYSVGYELIR
jgi:hypothetical protein